MWWQSKSFSTIEWVQRGLNPIILLSRMDPPNHVSKWLDFQEKLIEIFTTSSFYSKFKENNKNCGTMLFGLFFVPGDSRTKMAHGLLTQFSATVSLQAYQSSKGSWITNSLRSIMSKLCNHHYFNHPMKAFACITWLIGWVIFNILYSYEYWIYLIEKV